MYLTLSILQVIGQIAEHGISLYRFSDGDTVDSFNVYTMLSDGRILRGREYPWGTVNIENKVGMEVYQDFLYQ